MPSVGSTCRDATRRSEPLLASSSGWLKLTACAAPSMTTSRVWFTVCPATSRRRSRPGMSGSRLPMTASVGMRRAGSRSRDGYWVRARRAATCSGRRTADSQARQPGPGGAAPGYRRGPADAWPGAGAGVQSAGRRHENGALDPVRVKAGELGDDRAAHRVPDERGGVDTAVVEEGSGDMGQVGDVQRTKRVAAASESGQVGDVGLELGGQPCGRRHKVGAGHPEAVQVRHHSAVNRGRLSVEDLDPVERRPAFGEDR